MHRPDLVNDMLIVLFLRDFLRRWQQGDDITVLVSMGPVGCRVAEFVTLVEVDILGDKTLHEVNVTLARRNVQAREASIVHDLWIAALEEKLGDCVAHVPLSREVHRSVSSNGIRVFGVWLRLRLEQDVDDV